jgi:3-oxoacyl-[acyl-carrier-protein] synthase-3
MDGTAVFQTAIKVVPKSIKELLSKNKVSIEEINWLIPHQPSIRILEEVANRISLPWEKVMTNMDRYANTSGATIPIMLDETVKKNLLKKGDLILFAAVGAGWTWGTALYKW